MTINFCSTFPSVEALMKFEQPYLPGLQFSLEEKREKLDEPDILGVWMWIDGRLEGEIYGSHDEDANPPWETMYCYSFTCLKPSLGLGTIMMANWLGAVKERGYWWVTGHARPGASQATQLKFGAVFDKDEADWCGTGETYKHYRIRL